MTTSEEPNPFRSPTEPDRIEWTDSLLGFWISLCVMAGVAIFLLPVWPSISILMTLGLAPAFVHAYIRLYRLAGQGELPEPLLQVGVVVASVFIVAAIALGTAIACGFLCFTTLTLMSLDRLGDPWMISTAVILGAILPLVIFVVLFIVSLGYTSKGRHPTSEPLPRNSSSEEPR